MRFLEGSLRSSADGRPRQRTSSREFRNFSRLDWPASPHHRGLSSPNRTRLRENAGNLTYPHMALTARWRKVMMPIQCA